MTSPRNSRWDALAALRPDRGQMSHGGVLGDQLATYPMPGCPALEIARSGFHIEVGGRDLLPIWCKVSFRRRLFSCNGRELRLPCVLSGHHCFTHTDPLGARSVLLLCICFRVSGSALLRLFYGAPSRSGSVLALTPGWDIIWNFFVIDHIADPASGLVSAGV